MIQVDNLSIAFQGNFLFKDASFSLQPGEKCGLIGRNGTGKSTLFRLLTKEEEPDSGTIAIPKNYRIGTLSQHLTFSQPTLVQEAALALSENERDDIYKAERILFGLGFKESDLDRAPASFSGGYQIRIQLAKLLITEPNCLLLDEPTNYLDIVSIRWFSEFLRKWRGEFILITHDREFMDSVVTHTMGIHRQKVKKLPGDTVSFLGQILQEEEVYEKTRQNLEKKKAQSQAFIDRFGAKAAKAAQAQSRQKMLSRIPTLEKLKEIYHLDFNFREAYFPGKRMLEAENVSFDYNPDAEHPLIHDFSLAIEKGERVAIIGKNGRGKSTILKLLAQELAPSLGSIRQWESVNLGYFGQTNIDRLHPKHTIEEEIASANRKLNFTEVKGICGLMMFSGDKSEKLTSVLSGGERSRVLLGKIVATPCNLLLLDEPTHHLDMESIEALIDAIEDFEGTVVIVTHSELILKRMALDKIVICHQHGQEMFLGNYEEFLEKRGWDDEESQKNKKKSGDQQKEKRERANFVTARSKLLKPLDDEIARKEARIAELETELAQSYDKMTTIAQSGKGTEIQNLSILISAGEKEMEGLYTDLDLLYKKRDAMVKQLEK